MSLILKFLKIRLLIRKFQIRLKLNFPRCLVLLNYMLIKFEPCWPSGTSTFDPKVVGSNFNSRGSSENYPLLVEAPVA